MRQVRLSSVPDNKGGGIPKLPGLSQWLWCPEGKKRIASLLRSGFPAMSVAKPRSGGGLSLMYPCILVPGGSQLTLCLSRWHF